MEYIILVALLAVASIPVVKVLGDSFRSNVLQSADALVDGTLYDDDTSTQITNSTNKVRRSMNNFHNTGRAGKPE